MTKAAAEPTAHAIIHMNSHSHVTEGASDSVCRTVLTLMVNALHLMTRSQMLGKWGDSAYQVSPTYPLCQNSSSGRRVVTYSQG